jgi:hypothetical protein
MHALRIRALSAPVFLCPLTRPDHGSFAGTPFVLDKGKIRGNPLIKLSLSFPSLSNPSISNPPFQSLPLVLLVNLIITTRTNKALFPSNTVDRCILGTSDFDKIS